jgi:ketosteroid isomerase-like protein
MIMRLPLARLLVLVVTVSLAACAGSAPSQEFGKADADQVKQMVQDFVAAYNAQDVAKVGTFFSANATLMPANQSTLHGVDSLKSWFELRFKDDGARDLAIEPIAVEGHGSLGYVAGTFSLNLQPPNGPARRDRGKVVWLVHKYSGQWKFELQIMSSDLPPALPPAAPPAK